MIKQKLKQKIHLSASFQDQSFISLQTEFRYWLLFDDEKQWDKKNISIIH